MERARRCGLVVAVLLATVTAGCAASPSEPTQPIPVSQETSQVESPEVAEPESAAPAEDAQDAQDAQDAEVAKARAAIAQVEDVWKQSLFAFTQVPDGFVFSEPGEGTVFKLRDEDSAVDDFAAIRFVRGEDQLLLLQGSWDMGAGTEGKTASPSDFGGLDATFLRDVDFGWYSTDTATASVVIVKPSSNGNLALFGVGVTQDELEDTAAALEQLK